ncbi:MAG: MBL fold metallo-hydrolase [Calditrichaceae bacterium]|nr:MBL fold metallo-hydrolase [Calditrichaceae bacterium]
MAKIQIIYDNTTLNNSLKADWGFSALISAHNKTILFDTGGNGQILLENMQKLSISPESISDVFISHSHFDHIGGLSHFLNENNNVTVHVPKSFRGVRSAEKVVYYDHPVQLFSGLYTTGELDGIEQSMVIETAKGLLIIAGCSHPPMEKIINAAKTFGSVFGIIGGLHGFDQFDLFKNFELICPTHCTQYIKEIKNRFPHSFIEGGAGRVIDI